MSKATERLERLKQQEAQLKARIQQEQARISASARKERTGKLIAGAWSLNRNWLKENFLLKAGFKNVNACSVEGHWNVLWLKS